jgi:hypothetical protein
MNHKRFFRFNIPPMTAALRKTGIVGNRKPHRAHTLDLHPARKRNTGQLIVRKLNSPAEIAHIRGAERWGFPICAVQQHSGRW